MFPDGGSCRSDTYLLGAVYSVTRRQPSHAHKCKHDLSGPIWPSHVLAHCDLWDTPVPAVALANTGRYHAWHDHRLHAEAAEDRQTQAKRS